MKANFWAGEVGIHVFSGKAAVKSILERSQAACVRHQRSKHSLFPVVSLVADKPRAGEDQSLNSVPLLAMSLTPRCDVDTSFGLCP